MNRMFFPVLLEACAVPLAQTRTWPRSVPWAFVAPWRARIEKNHNRTLEQLARSGGLTPVEMWLGAHDLDPDHFIDIGEGAAARWLIAELSKGTV